MTMNNDDAAPAAAPAAPAPDAVADTVTILRSRDLELPEFHAMQMRVADLIEQQAREFAQVMRERNDANRACLEELTRADRAERDLSAARAAIAAARELLTHARCPQKCTNGTTPYGEQCQWCDERDRLRAAMGDGNG